MNNLFVNTLHGNPGHRPPVWLMRQAGRILDSYQSLRSHYSFQQLMETPQLAAKVTLLPVIELEVDAAILFNDILSLPKAMGMDMQWTQRGPVFTNPLSGMDNPAGFLGTDISGLDYVYETIDRIVEQHKAPLIGFCGAPLTVMCYMIEGISGNQSFPVAQQFITQRRSETEKILETVTQATIHYATQQAEHGIDCFQLFESNAGIIPFEVYKELFLPAVRRILLAVRDKGVPVIFFPKGIGLGLKHIDHSICDFVSIDWQTPILDARQAVDPKVGLQGNFDPQVLTGDTAGIDSMVDKYLSLRRQNPLWIANLGHGVLPHTPIDNVRHLIKRIKATDWT